RDRPAHRPQQHLHVLPAVLLPPLVPQQRGRVERADDRDVLVLVELPAELTNPDVRAQHVLRRGRSEADDVLRPHKGELTVEILPAVVPPTRKRNAVVRRPALDRVADVHVLPLEPAGRDDLVEELARLADERLSGRVLVRTRGLADEANVGIDWADPED